MAATRRRRAAKKNVSARGARGPRGKTGKTGKTGPAGKPGNNGAVSLLSDQMQDVQKELARLLRRTGEIQAQLDRLAAREPSTRTG